MTRRMYVTFLGAVASSFFGYAGYANAADACTCGPGERLVRITGTGNTNVLNDPYSAPASLGTTTINSDDGNIELVCGVRGVILGASPPVPFTSYIQCRDKQHSEVVLYTLLTYPDPLDTSNFVEQTVPGLGGTECGIDGRRGVFLGITKGSVTISGTSIPASDNGQPLQDWKVKGGICLPKKGQGS